VNYFGNKVSGEPHEKSKRCSTVLLQKLGDLLLEMMETVLMSAFLMLYPSDVEGDDDNILYQCGKSRSAERRAFRLLSAVCSHWHMALIGWPESPTSQWVKHRIKKKIESKYIQYMQIYVCVLDYSDILALGENRKVGVITIFNIVNRGLQWPPRHVV